MTFLDPPRGDALAALTALGVALALGHGARAEIVRDPVAAAKAEIEARCSEVAYPEDFARFVDLNGDRRQDLILRYAVICDNAPNAFCGKQGCEGHVYLADPAGGYRLTDLPPDLEPTRHAGRPALRLPPSGEACGAACETLLAWDGAAFVSASALETTAPLGLNAPIAASRADAPGNVPATVSDAAPATATIATPERPSAAPDVISVNAAATMRPSRIEEADQAETNQAETNQAETDQETEEADAEPLAAPPELPPRAASDPSALPERPNSDAWWVETGETAGFASILGADGVTMLSLGCEADDPTLTIALALGPEAETAIKAPRETGALLAVEFHVRADGDDAEEVRLLAYDAETRAWRDRLTPELGLAAALSRGVRVSAREPEQPAALFEGALNGSSRAIAHLRAICDL